MSLCSQCGNALVHGCGPVCFVCQHTSRGKPVTATEVNACLSDANARGMAAALGAVYKALEAASTPEQEVQEAQDRLRYRIRNPEHNRERPNWDEIDAEERERQPVCQTCNGIGVYLARRCPDCSED